MRWRGVTDQASPDLEDAAARLEAPEEKGPDGRGRSLRWPRPWTREFWTIDIVYAAIGVGLSIVSTVLIAYLSAGFDRHLHDQVVEMRRLDSVFRAGGRELFEMAAASAQARTIETYLENVAGDDQRRTETAAAIALSLRSFKTYLSILAPDALPSFTVQTDAWLKAFLAGDDTMPATIRASIVRYINGPVADANNARAARRNALSGEIAATRNTRDFWRSLGAFFQVFGIIFAICGQIAGRRARARQFAPPDLKRRLSTGVFTRDFWTIDVIAVVAGSIISLAGTIALYFVVVSYHHAIDETRGLINQQGMQIELTHAANHAYDDMGLLEIWVSDLNARRPDGAHVPPDVSFKPMEGEEAAPVELPPQIYVRSRRFFALFWLARMARDNDPQKFAPLIDEFYRVYEDLEGPGYADYTQRVRSEAAAKLNEIERAQATLAGELNALEVRQTLARDTGGLLQLLGLLLAFAGYLAYYKRPRL